MEFKASQRIIRITPRKMGLIADEVRGKLVNQALTYLKFSPRSRTSTMIANVIKNAAANALQKGTVDVDKLYVKSILIGKGPTLKRFRARAKGAASPIMKRTSHVFVTVAEK